MSEKKLPPPIFFAVMIGVFIGARRLFDPDGYGHELFAYLIMLVGGVIWHFFGRK